MVILPQQRLDCLGSLFRFVKGNTTKEVMNHMIINDFVEEMTTNETCRAINCRQCTFRIGPSFCGIVWNGGMGMLKICDGNCESSQLLFPLYLVRWGCIIAV
jgi:hypothetical protein